MFLGDNFLLNNPVSTKLYHDYAEPMPIIDYHCHLDPKEIYDNIKFENITQAWLYGDHYKWRLMRANGVLEKLITGDGEDYEKFLAWAETIEGCIGNPLYVWTHLELRRIFGIDEVLNKKSAPQIWEKANRIIQQDNMSTREIIKKFKVKVICTTDDPASNLEYHKKIAAEEDNFKVFPTFRPDKALNISLPTFKTNIVELGNMSDIDIQQYDDLLTALKQRINYFHENGCRLSDHGFGNMNYVNAKKEEINKIFQKAMSGEPITKMEVDSYQSQLLVDLMKMYSDKKWTAQLHIQASRNNNTNLFKAYGADVGADAITDGPAESAISGIFDRLTIENKLPKVILYSLNPKDYISLVALMGCFQEEEPGKIQFGSAWWFNDTYSGMRHQMITLDEGGIFANFVGMLTDSRSFLSYPRHEYFRRILCELIAEWVNQGQFPEDYELLGNIVRRISYENASTYFGFDA